MALEAPGYTDRRSWLPSKPSRESPATASGRPVPDGELIPDYESTFPTINEGEVVHGTGRPGRQGRSPRRHRLQVGRRHSGRRALDPAVGQPGRRGLRRRRDRRARDDEGGRRGPADPLEEARALRDGLEGDRERRRVRRAGQRSGDRGRQGRTDPRPRRARLPAGVARRHPPRPGPRRVHGQGAPLQGDRAQPLAQQRRAVAPRRPRGRAQGDAPGDPRQAQPGRRRRGHRSRTSSTSAPSSTSTAWTA